MGYGRNKPGQSARRIADQIYLKRAGVALGGVLALLLCLKLLPVFAGAGIGAMVVLIVVMKAIGSTVETKAKAYRKEERKAERGAKAEETVREVLGQLQGPYDVMHDVDTGYGDIDHILLSRDYGVFVLETKSHFGEVTIHNGTLLIGGQQPEKDFIAQALRNTMWLKQRIKETTGLDPWIQPIIVFTRAFVREWKPIRGVLVRNQKYLVEAIEKTRANETLTSRLWALHEQGASLW
jgi:hypothetical protein